MPDAVVEVAPLLLLSCTCVLLCSILVRPLAADTVLFSVAIGLLLLPVLYHHWKRPTQFLFTLGILISIFGALRVTTKPPWVWALVQFLCIEVGVISLGLFVLRRIYQRIYTS